MQYTIYVQTKVGVWQVTADATDIVRVKLVDAVGAARSNAVVERAAAELVAYYAGELQTFTVPMQAQGTEFQKKVWRAIAAVKCGETITYTQLARTIGSPRAVRAVANACGANPLPLLVPCHRVVRGDGSLGGYALGIELKQKLLTHEKQFSKKCAESY